VIAMSFDVSRWRPTLPVSGTALKQVWSASGRMLLAIALGGALGALMPAGTAPWAPTAAAAQESPAVIVQPAARTLSVSGSGQTSAFPDMATIQAGVMTEAETAADAVARNNTLMQEVIRSLEQAGVASKDVSTSDFAVNPKYQQQDNQAPKLVGYIVSNMVSVRVRALDTLGTTLDRLVTAGANQINGIQFIVSKADELLDEARKSAVAAARRKAETYAAAAGVELGAVLSISEGGYGGPSPMARATMMEKADSVPIAIGQQTLDVQVSVVWALK
jgi:uncharacterized protein